MSGKLESTLNAARVGLFKLLDSLQRDYIIHEGAKDHAMAEGAKDHAMAAVTQVTDFMDPRSLIRVYLNVLRVPGRSPPVLHEVSEGLTSSVGKIPAVLAGMLRSGHPSFHMLGKFINFNCY